MAKTINKKFYESKTFWVNALGIGAVVLGYAPLSPEDMTTALAIINMGLRLISQDKVVLK